MSATPPKSTAFARYVMALAAAKIDASGAGITEFDGSERRETLRWRFSVTDHRPVCFLPDDPLPSLVERYPNGGYEISIHLADHECIGSEEVDVAIELWAYTDDEPDWFVSWKLNPPLGSNWPFSIEFCPFCGISLAGLYRNPDDPR